MSIQKTKTNWKYIFVVVFLSIISVGMILRYVMIIRKEIYSFKLSEIKKKDKFIAIEDNFEARIPENIEISTNKELILNADTQEIILSLGDAEKEYSPTYNSQSNNSESIVGDCFSDVSFSNSKRYIVFLMDCLPEGLPSLFGIYDLIDREINFVNDEGCENDFIWSEDDKILSCEMNFGPSPEMTYFRTFDVNTGSTIEKYLEDKNGKVYDIFPLPDFVLLASFFESVSVNINDEDKIDELSMVIIQTLEKEDEYLLSLYPCVEVPPEEMFFRYIYDITDLNDDEIEEFIIAPMSYCGRPIRGASGNGPFYVLQKEDNTWISIGRLEGNVYGVSNKKTDSYRDIMTHWHKDSGSYYLWDKSISTYKKLF